MKPKREDPFKIVFFGTPDFAVPALKRLLELPEVSVCAVVTQPDRPAGRGKKLRMSPVKELALARGISVLQPENIRKNIADFQASLTSLGPLAAAVVVSFGQILPESLLNLPAAGCINIHASLLPRWRGAAPIQRAIMSGDAVTGVCLMKVAAKLDAGPVYSRSEVKIEPRDDAGSLHDKLACAGAELLVRDLKSILAGRLQPAEQPQQDVSVACKISNEEALLDWSQPAAQLWLKVRALCPAPGAFTYLNGRRLKIFRAVPRECPSFRAAPQSAAGSMVMLDPRCMEVYCGSGLLSLEEVQLDGKRRMKISEFLRGAAIAPGTVLGAQ